MKQRIWTPEGKLAVVLEGGAGDVREPGQEAARRGSPGDGASRAA